MKFSDCNTETLVELTEYLLSLIESGKTSTAFTNLYMGLTTGLMPTTRTFVSLIIIESVELA